jgi:RhtB (resistance to homoserine/threonine) family protein
MFGTQHLALFITSGILLNITPGQDTLYIVGRSLSQGRRAGLLSVAGITAGSGMHTLAAAFGLSAVLATSASAFTVIKLAGAAYLVYLGVGMLRDRSPQLAPASFGHESDWAVFRAGFVTNLLNPKVALFFLAFLPQFVDPAASSRVLAFLFLGAVFIVNGTLWCLVLAYGAAGMSRRLRENPSAAVLVKRAAGALFVGLGVRLAASR